MVTECLFACKVTQNALPAHRVLGYADASGTEGIHGRQIFQLFNGRVRALALFGHFGGPETAERGRSQGWRSVWERERSDWIFFGGGVGGGFGGRGRGSEVTWPERSGRPTSERSGTVQDRRERGRREGAGPEPMEVPVNPQNHAHHTGQSEEEEEEEGGGGEGESNKEVKGKQKQSNLVSSAD